MGDQYASGIQFVDMSDMTSMKNDAITEVNHYPNNNNTIHNIFLFSLQIYSKYTIII